MTDADRRRMYERLRRPPSPHTVERSLPVLFFGDLPAAKIATVGLNPSWQEYLAPSGGELTDHARRFQTLASLGARDRSSLTDEQCDRAIRTMREYYQPGKPVYGWFAGLDRVVSAMGSAYESGEVAHLDLVQEPTRPTWSQLHVESPGEATELLATDRPFLRWQLERFAIEVIVCNGRTPFDQVRELVGGQIMETGRLARVTWYAGIAAVAGRRVRLVGWNIPLSRPTGLGSEGEWELGRVLAGSSVAPHGTPAEPDLIANQEHGMTSKWSKATGGKEPHAGTEHRVRSDVLRRAVQGLGAWADGVPGSDLEVRERGYGSEHSVFIRGRKVAGYYFASQWMYWILMDSRPSEIDMLRGGLSKPQEVKPHRQGIRFHVVTEGDLDLVKRVLLDRSALARY